MTISNKLLALLSAFALVALLLPTVPASAQTGAATMPPRPEVGPSDTTTVTGASGSSGPSATTTVPPAQEYREMPYPGIPGGNDRLQRLKDNPPNAGIDPTPGVKEQR